MERLSGASALAAARSIRTAAARSRPASALRPALPETAGLIAPAAVAVSVLPTAAALAATE
jgi:hypothetical protein